MELQIQYFPSYEMECIIGNKGYLGEGSFGVIRLAFHKVHGLVALKCSVMHRRWEKNKHLEGKIKKEIKLMLQADHENIVRVYGWTNWPRAIAIVMEYISGGNLMEMLENDDISLEPLLRLRMIYEIANGIAFIHNFSPSKILVHGDIKAENILLTEDLHCKLADFGSARLFAHTGGSTTTSHHEPINQFTKFYASPELLQRPTSKLKPPHDTYSFSVTMYAVIGREFPILTEIQMNLYLESVKKGNRLEMDIINDYIDELKENGLTNDVKVITVMKELMEECWKQNPTERPHMIEVKEKLCYLLKQQDLVKIQQYAVDVAGKLGIQKLSRDQCRCVPLHELSAPDFEFKEDPIRSFNPPLTSANIVTDLLTSTASTNTNTASISEVLPNSSPEMLSSAPSTIVPTALNQFISSSQTPNQTEESLSSSSTLEINQSLLLPEGKKDELNAQQHVDIATHERYQDHINEGLTQDFDRGSLIGQQKKEISSKPFPPTSAIPAELFARIEVLEKNQEQSLKKQDILKQMKQLPDFSEGKDLIKICKDVMKLSDDDFTSEVASLFPNIASLRKSRVSIEDAQALSFVLKKLNKKIRMLNLSWCRLTSETLKFIVDGFREMKGSIDCMYIMYNHLSSVDVERICILMEKVNRLLDVHKCFDDGNREMRNASPTEILKLQQKLSLIEKSSLKVCVSYDDSGKEKCITHSSQNETTNKPDPTQQEEAVN